MSEQKTTFDTALPRFAEAICTALSSDALKNGVVVRDTTGRLAFVVDDVAPSETERQRIERQLKNAIDGYARTDRVVAFRNDQGASRLLIDAGRIPVAWNGLTVQLIDRRIVGTAWLDAPSEEPVTPPRIVFASLKGGVGRSTALAIAAADLARRSRNVLVIDLDLEAPGLGDLLLGEGRKPSLGTVDFLVETGIRTIEDSELGAFVGISELTSTDGGRVDVVPAFGKLSIENPENILPKLARAMIEAVGNDGGAVSVTVQIAKMISRLSAMRDYDVVLIDSRAGLAELTAPAMLGLGASVLLFGTAQKQTIEAYRALLAALGLLAQRDLNSGKPASWRQMLKAVHAKASLDPTVTARYRDEMYEIFAEFLYDAEDSASPSSDAFAFNIDDPIAPHWPLIIPFNPSFADFDSVRNANQLTQSFYEQTFRSFMDGIDALIENSIPSVE
jgi:cellulose biosynthesis protein BcsQ